MLTGSTGEMNGNFYFEMSWQEFNNQIIASIETHFYKSLFIYFSVWNDIKLHFFLIFQVHNSYKLKQ